MKRKIISAVADILGIMIAFSLTDWITRNIFATDKWWVELLTYLVIYAALAAVRRLIRCVWRRLTTQPNDNITDTEKE